LAVVVLSLPKSLSAQENKLIGPFKTLQELEASLTASGVTDAEKKNLLAMAIPCAALVSTAADDKDIAIGQSKIGGAPDLPKDMKWPSRRPLLQEVATKKELLKRNSYGDHYAKILKQEIALAEREAPLAFILQVDFAAAWKAGPLDPDIPSEGRLLVFYDLILKPWHGTDEDGTSRFQAIYTTEAPESLQRHSPPDLGIPIFGDEEDYKDYRNQLPAARLSPVFTYTLPDGGSLPYMIYYARGKKVEHEEWLNQSPTHLNATNRVGGWPENIQGDMAVQLAAEDHGIELPYMTDRYWMEAERIQHLADEWVHLLQIGDYDNKIMDFDGLYHLWIKREHLKNRDFSKAKLIFRTS